MSHHPLDPAIQDLFHSLTPLSSNDEVDRLLTSSVTPEPTLVDHNAEESDLTPLSSSDEEVGNIKTTPHPIEPGRTLRPRVAKALTSTAKDATSSPEPPRLSFPPSPVDQASWTRKKRNRTENLRDQTPPATPQQKPRPDAYVTQETCHQCRNRPRYAFMRCTSDGMSARPCRKLFCVSCITKRYPDDIDFNPQLKKWKCPLCRDMCNCTKCCAKRKEEYTSTSKVKIDHDTLLRYAALMPSSSNSREPLSPRPSKPTERNSKRANRSNSKPARDPAKTKPSVEKVRNPGPARDLNSIVRGLEDTAAMFEKFGCDSGDYWGVVFSNVDGGRIGVAHVGDYPPDIFFLRDEGDDDPPDGSSPPPTKRLRVSPEASS